MLDGYPKTFAIVTNFSFNRTLHKNLTYMSNPFETPPEPKKEQVSVPCPNCGGSGTVTEGGKKTSCKRCNGSGRILSN